MLNRFSMKVPTAAQDLCEMGEEGYSVHYSVGWSRRQ
uniref:Uncharacterized protein n=1 Tax=Lepeophtheirus salmonis TaxID=72036 RepID=A0A0K2SYX0_LEPSM